MLLACLLPGHHVQRTCFCFSHWDRVRNPECLGSIYTFILMVPTISRRLSFSGSNLWISKSRFNMSFESSGCFRREWTLSTANCKVRGSVCCFNSERWRGLNQAEVSHSVCPQISASLVLLLPTADSQVEAYQVLAFVQSNNQYINLRGSIAAVKSLTRAT